LRRKQWEDCKEAIKALQNLPQDKLKELLGDKFGMLITLDVVKADKGPAKRGGVRPSSDEAAKPLKHARDEVGEDENGRAMLPKRTRCNKSSVDEKVKGDEEYSC
jgi:hypothetical protein